MCTCTEIVTEVATHLLLSNSKHWFTTSFLQLWRKVPESDAGSECVLLYVCVCVKVSIIAIM